MDEIAERRRWFVPNAAPERIGEKRRDAKEVIGPRTGEGVRLAVVLRLHQRGGGDLRDVSKIHESHPAMTRGDEQTTILPNVSQVCVLEVLREEAGSKKRIATTTRLQVTLYGRVRDEAVLLGSGDGQEDDPLHPERERSVNEEVQRRLHPGNGWRSQQEDTPNSSQRGIEGIGPLEVEPNGLDARREAPHPVLGAADARSNGRRADGGPTAERGHDLATGVPGRSGDEKHR